MSYTKAMRHFKNQRKDRFTQQCGGPRPNAFQKVNNPVPYVDALEVLDEIDRYRRDCYIMGSPDMDFAMRKACQIIASAAGYADRASWMNALNATTTEDIPHEDGMAVALDVLRKIESWREKHSQEPWSVDHALRTAEAVVAIAAGFKDRNTWTDALKRDANSAYFWDSNNMEYPVTVW